MIYSFHLQYPTELKRLFTTKFAPANPTALLDWAGAEVLLIPSRHSVQENIGDSVKQLVLKKEDDGEDSDGVKAAKEALGRLGLLDTAGSAMEGHWS